MSEAVSIALIAALPPTLMAAVAFWQGLRNRASIHTVGEKMDTGNGAALGSTVHRIDETLDWVATAVKAQGETQHAQGVQLDRGTQRFGDLDGKLASVADMVNDQRIEQEAFVTKVSPLCDWVERQQREETA